MKRILILVLLATLSPACGGGGSGGRPTILPPSNVVASVQSSSQIKVTWTNNATNQTGFNVLRSLDGIIFVLAGSTIPTVTTFMDTGLFPLSTFTYIVVAVDGLFQSPSSNIASATTKPAIWTKLAPGGTLPATRTSVAAINDLTTGQMIAYGGDDGSFPYDGNDLNTMALNLGGGPPAWTYLAPGPAVRIDYSFVFNPVTKMGVLFGGTDGTAPQNATWLLDPATGWTTLPTGGQAPTARFGHSAVFLGTKMYVFGGQNANSPPNNLLNDIYALDFALTPPTWTQLSPAGIPPTARMYHTAIADSGNSQMVMFGGTDGSNPRNDTWFLSLSGTPTWTPLTVTAVPPSARFGAAGVYNSVSLAFVIFGGYSSAGPSNDVWMLSLSGTPTWEQILPAGPLPENRGRCATIFDALTARMIIFAGDDPSTFTSYNNMWALGF